MKRIFYCLLLLSTICFNSCEKNDPDTSDIDKGRLKTLSDQFTISCEHTGADAVLWNFSSSGYSYTSDDYIVIEWKVKNGGANWSRQAFSVNSQIFSIKGLTPQTEYQFRFSFYNATSGTSVEKQTCDFTTRSFDFNYEKIYPSYLTKEYGSVSFFSLEDGVHTLYGYGFKNTPLEFSFVSQSDPADNFKITPVVLNDSTLTLKIPSDIIPNKPFVLCKFYKVLVNGLPIVNSSEYYNQKINGMDVYKVSNNAAEFDVFNKDFTLDSVKIDYKKRTVTNPYDNYNFTGHMGLDNTGDFDETYLGISMAPLHREIVIKSGGNVIKIIDLTNRSSNIAYFVYLREWNLYRSNTFIEVQKSAGYQVPLDLVSGTYSAQYVTRTNGGIVKSTNEYSFTVNRTN